MKTNLARKKSALLFIFVSLLVSVELAQAGCRTRQLRLIRSSGFGISIGGGSSSFSGADSTTLNLPVQVGDQSGCYQQTSKLEMKAVSKKSDFNGSVMVAPLKATFENVPDSNVTTYIMLSRAHSDPRQVQFNVLSAACAGETTVVAEAFVGTLTDVVDLNAKQASFSTSTIIATGPAAQALQGRLRRSEMPAVISAEYRRLLPVQSNTSVRQKGQKVVTPQVMANSNVSANNGSLKSGVVSGNLMDEHTMCSQEFKRTMQIYNIEFLGSNPTAQAFKLGRSFKGDYLIEF